METAVIIPNDVFQQAEALARRIGLSRDELYTQALRRLLDASRDDEITRQLNEIYDREDSAPDSALMQMQMTALRQEDW